MSIWLCFWFSSICLGKISQNVHNLCNLSCRSFKSQKKLGCRGSFLAIYNLCFLLYLKFGPMNFLKTGRRKDRNMFKNQTNLKIFHQRKRNKSFSKDPYFLCRKTLHNGIELRQNLYLSMRKLSKLSPFGNLSHSVFVSVDLFFNRRRPMNITGAVAGNPWFHEIKTVLCETALTQLFR